METPTTMPAEAGAAATSTAIVVTTANASLAGPAR
jgi:hypothetical protein